MPTLSFIVGPSAVGQLHDMLACLAKFNEDISLEATQAELRISSLNVSKTAYAAFVLSGSSFFERYDFSAGQQGGGSKVWACKLQNRALASVFRRRLSENKDKDTGLERCEFELQARSDLPECRLVIRLICHLGIVKTYRLTYETGEILHASFDKSASPNTWSISSKTLADVVEYFGPKTEQLDWYLQDGKVTFTSYTEKVQSGKEILKQPMHTSVSLEKRDFDECHMEENLHIGIVVKDFRAVVAHAGSLQASVNAKYSHGNRPMQISYGAVGIAAVFTLMTRGISSGANLSSSTPARNLSVQPKSQLQQPTHGISTREAQTQQTLPHPETSSARRSSDQPDTRQPRQTTPPATAASLNPDSLFIPAEDDDQQWDEPTYDDEQDFVTWDASEHVNPSTSIRRVRDSEQTSFASAREQSPRQAQEIAPTQRLSQIKGLFD